MDKGVPYPARHGTARHDAVHDVSARTRFGAAHVVVRCVDEEGGATIPIAVRNVSCLECLLFEDMTRPHVGRGSVTLASGGLHLWNLKRISRFDGLRTGYQ